jgi:hypothetical protein
LAIPSLLIAAPSPLPSSGKLRMSLVDGEPSNVCCTLRSRSAGSIVAADSDCSTGTGISGIISASWSRLPSACARTAGALSAACSGPKPGIAFGSLKSHWFSAMPIKVANCRIVRPGLAQCSPGQFGGHAGLQKPPDVRIGGDRFNRWQACQVKRLIGRRFGPRLRGRSFSAGRNCF